MPRRENLLFVGDVVLTWLADAIFPDHASADEVLLDHPFKHVRAA
jgi:hypothetical protein